MTGHGPEAGCGWLFLAVVVLGPLVAYWLGGSGILGQLFGWLF